MKNTSVKWLTASTCLVALAACGGGDDGGGGTNPPGGGTTPTVSVSGSLVTPETATTTTLRVFASTSDTVVAAAAVCPDVPTSYLPLAGVSVSFLDASGASTATAVTTDACGKFTATVPQSTTQVSAAPPGAKVIKVPVSTFTTATSSIVSAVPAAASYQLASMQYANAKLAFTIVDTVTNKAVLGLPSSAVSLKVNTQAKPVGTITYAATQAQGNASVALAIDASGSMDTTVYDPVTNNALKDAQGNTLTRFRMAALAANAFLNGKQAGDEVGYVLFDHRVTWLDQAFFNGTSQPTIALQALADSSAYTYSYTNSGFSTNTALLRFPIDVYNYSSKLWGTSRVDALNAASPQVRATSSYPWGGSTAAYDAGSAALQKVVTASNARKLVVLLTDGEDNYSQKTPDTLIAEAKTAGVPVWTVALGADANAAKLQRIATETGGNFVSSTDPSALAAQFIAIQTGIVFQYQTGALTGIATGDTLALSIAVGADTVSRSLIVP